jgi:hypothetical protein
MKLSGSWPFAAIEMEDDDSLAYTYVALSWQGRA